METSRRRAVRSGMAAMTLALLVVALPLSACAATVVETRPLPAFQAIALKGSIDVEVRQGETQAVQVSADEQALAQLETVVEPGPKGPTLQVRWQERWWAGKRGTARVIVTLPRLLGVSVSGSGDVDVAAFETPSLELAIAGSGDIRLQRLNSGELGVRIAGSGDVKAQGRVARVKVDIAGSGDADLADVSAEDVAVRIAGSGDVRVDAQRTLDVHIAGSGDVTYSGTPAVKVSKVGRGSVTPR